MSKTPKESTPKIKHVLVMCQRDPTSKDEPHMEAEMTVWISLEYHPHRVFTCMPGGKWLFQGKFLPEKERYLCD